MVGGGRGQVGVAAKGKTKPDVGLARMPPSLVSDERVWHVKRMTCTKKGQSQQKGQMQRDGELC